MATAPPVTLTMYDNGAGSYKSWPTVSPSVNLTGRSITCSPGAVTVQTSSGSIADGNAYNLTGTGFGTRTSVSGDWWGGLNGYIDTSVVGTTPIDFSSSNRTNWSAVQSATGAYPKWSNTQVWSRGKSIAFDTRVDPNEYKQGYHYDTVTGYSRMYTNALYYLQHDTILSGAYLQWKMMRWTRTKTVVDGDGSYMAYRVGTSAASFFTFFNSAGQTVKNFDDPGATELPGRGAWYRLETWLKLNSAPGTPDGYFRVRATNPTTGVVATDNIYTNCAFNGASDSGTYRYLTLQNYFGNYIKPPAPETANGVAWMGDFYIAHGTTDDVFKYAMVSDNAAYASGAYREIQPISSWADTSVQFPINKGGMANLTGKYTYLRAGLPDATVGTSHALV